MKPRRNNPFLRTIIVAATLTWQSSAKANGMEMAIVSQNLSYFIEPIPLTMVGKRVYDCYMLYQRKGSTMKKRSPNVVKLAPEKVVLGIEQAKEVCETHWRALGGSPQ